jgi:hypothetical protein
MTMARTGSAASASPTLPQNYPLQLAGARSKVVITVRLLEVQRQSALSRAFEKTACS